MAGMFSKTDETTHTVLGGAHTVLGTTVHVEGTLESEEDIVIAGKLNGSIKTSKNLNIHSGAHVTADITAHDVLVSGEVKGNIHAAGTVTLTSTAVVSGDIAATNIAIEHGAQLKGQMSTESVK